MDEYVTGGSGNDGDGEDKTAQQLEFEALVDKAFAAKQKRRDFEMLVSAAFMARSAAQVQADRELLQKARLALEYVSADERDGDSR